jgi:hypothetical protein
MSAPPPGHPFLAPPPDDPLISTTLEVWFGRGYAAFRRSWWRVARLWLLGSVPIGAALGLAVAAFVADPAGPGPLTVALGGLALAVSMIVAYTAQAASVFVLVTDAAGHRTSVPEAARFGLTRALPQLGWGLLTGLAVLLGALLLIVPGVYLWAVFGGTLLCVVCVERADPRRCLDLVRGRWWATAGRLLLASVVAGFAQAPAQFLAFGAGLWWSMSPGGGPGVAVAVVLGTLAAIVVAATIALSAIVTTTLHVVTYAELRWRENPAVSTATLAGELTR